MRIFTIVLIGILLVAGCKKKQAPQSPESAILVFPDANSECTTGESINDTESVVEFRWLAANNTQTYELRLTNLNTNITKNASTSALRAKVTLDKGAPYSWIVVSKNTQVTQTATSKTWRFYNAGFLTTHPPFPPEIISPELSESIFKDINNEVTLEWNGADVDNDISGYDVYFSTETPPESLITSNNDAETTQKVGVASNTTYYWRIVARDSEGNTSDSGIFEFKVL